MTTQEAEEIAQLINNRNHLIKNYTFKDILSKKECYVFIKEDNKVIACAASNKIQWYQHEITHVSISEHFEGKGYGSRILALAEKKGEPPFILILDGIEDPHNLGAIIRTANQAGAHGVIIPKRRAVGLTPTVARTSAGAINYTPVAKVTNLKQTMEQLKKEGMWFVCADMDGTPYYQMNLKGPMGLVIGNEGEGVSRLIKETCDFVASIPMKGDIDSLNASVAAGVLAFEIARQRG